MTKETEMISAVEQQAMPAVQKKIELWKKAHAEKLLQLAGDKDKADKLFVICLNTISRNPDLLSCTFESIAGCILQSFQIGLMPGIFQECAFIPLNNTTGKTTVKEANFWIQYQGLVKLLLNAGNKAVVARVVFENDHFLYKESEDKPEYAPAVVLGKKRGKPLFAYSAVCTASNFWQVEVMSPEQIQVIKGRSRGASSSLSPWNSKFEDDVYAMWSKTVLKRVSKWCTKSAELVKAIEIDDEKEESPVIIDLVNNFKNDNIQMSQVDPIYVPEIEMQQMKTIEIPKSGIKQEVNNGSK